METNWLTIENLIEVLQITNKQEQPQKGFINVSKREKGSKYFRKGKQGHQILKDAIKEGRVSQIVIFFLSKIITSVMEFNCISGGYLIIPSVNGFYPIYTHTCYFLEEIC